MIINDLQDAERRQHNQEVLQKIFNQANARTGPVPRWAIVPADGFNKKLVHCPPVTVTEYSDAVREYIAVRLGYTPSDNAIDFVLQHLWRR